MKFGFFLSLIFSPLRRNLPGPTERNYHIFYQLIAGASSEQTKKYHLKHPSNFRILSAGDTYEVDGMNDKSWFQSIEKAMKAFHFDPSER